MEGPVRFSIGIPPIYLFKAFHSFNRKIHSKEIPSRQKYRLIAFAEYRQRASESDSI